MRFAEEFYRCQSPQWSSFYIAYDELKTSIKIEQGRAKAAGKHSDVHGRTLIYRPFPVVTLTTSSHTWTINPAMPESREALSDRRL